MGLSFSNSDRQIFLYRELRNSWFKNSIRSSSSSDGCASSIAELNSYTKKGREYWYIGSMKAKSWMQKKRPEVRWAIG